MKNLAQMMKQAQEMQSKMAEMQAQLERIEATGVAGGGMVKAIVGGKGELRKLTIDKSLANPEEIEVLEDLVVAAFADAKARVEAQISEEMAKLTGGLKLPPGLKLPF